MSHDGFHDDGSIEFGVMGGGGRGVITKRGIRKRGILKYAIAAEPRAKKI